MQLAAFTLLFLAVQSNLGGGTIVGGVIDEQGYPVPNADVMAYRSGYDENGNLMVLDEAAAQPGTAHTESHGEFRIGGLKAGDYFVVVEPQLPSTGRPSDQLFPTTTYYPGTLDPVRAATVRVRDAEEYALGNFTLLSARLATVRLHVINSTGEPAEREFLAWGMSSMRNPSFVPGRAILPGLTHGMNVDGNDPEITNLPPASYGISVTLNSGNSAFVTRTTIDVNERDVYRELDVRPNPRVIGRVVVDDENGAVTPLPDVQVRMITDGSGPSPQGVSGSDGTFTIDRVTQRNFRLQFLNLPDDTYPESASDGGLDALLTPWILTRDVDLLIVIKRNGATASGTVIDKDSNPVSQATVVLVPDAREVSARYISTKSDGTGAFTIHGIAPGSYHLFAWRDIDGAPYRNSDFMRRYEQDGVSLSIERAQQVTSDVTVSVD
jgi:hypothetical protein